VGAPAEEIPCPVVRKISCCAWGSPAPRPAGARAPGCTQRCALNNPRSAFSRVGPVPAATERAAAHPSVALRCGCSARAAAPWAAQPPRTPPEACGRREVTAVTAQRGGHARTHFCANQAGSMPSALHAVSERGLVTLAVPARVRGGGRARGVRASRIGVEVGNGHQSLFFRLWHPRFGSSGISVHNF
jgi:hypothetical protein